MASGEMVFDLIEFVCIGVPVLFARALSRMGSYTSVRNLVHRLSNVSLALCLCSAEGRLSSPRALAE